MTTTDLTPASTGPGWDIPALRASPAIFRTCIRVCAENWRFGSIVWVLPSGEEIRCSGPDSGPDARIRVKDYRFIKRCFSAGAIGFAEGYMADEWETPDLAALLTGFAMNFDRLQTLVEGNPIVRAVNFVMHMLHRNDRSGSRKNIHAHYDLGNHFYSKWLDRTMTYSSAVYEKTGEPLDLAQQHKYAALARSMGLETGQSVLEIGCGWGGFAEFAAKEIGAKVTGITISQEQYDFARKRLFEQGLAEKTDIRLVDYRDVDGQFDRVASIEMFEAVGEEYWPTYFGKIRDVLSPGGRAGLQIITIRDELFGVYRRRADFIQKYIFPGGMLPSETRLRQETGKAGLGWQSVMRFGQDYAETLSEWMERFDAAWDDIRKQGFDDRFRRMWRYYLAYCEAGFRTGRTDVVQVGLSKS
ncbi:MAG TPA: cyclopropane-fatty-acyl-phospholipid synthase family protein [Caulobacter sp.]|nr:cyclopropane-fatty-acyl-phospholipid synthase family protein [Caulobacter sp.]